MLKSDPHYSYSVEVKDEDILDSGYLPNNITEFRAKDGTDKEMPWFKFYTYIAKAQGWDIEDIDVSNVFISSCSYIKLSQYEYEWLEKSISYFKHMTKRKKESTWGMHSLMWSPNVIKFEKGTKHPSLTLQRGYYIGKPGKRV